MRKFPKIVDSQGSARRGSLRRLPPELLQVIVEVSPCPLDTYLQLLRSLSHAIRQSIRGTLRELSFPEHILTTDALAALVGPCKSLRKLSFPEEWMHTSRGGARSWVDEAFGGHSQLAFLSHLPSLPDPEVEGILSHLSGLAELTVSPHLLMSTRLLAALARSCPSLQVLRCTSSSYGRDAHPDFAVLRPLSGVLKLASRLTVLKLRDGTSDSDLPGPWLCHLETLSLDLLAGPCVALTRLLAANQATLRRLTVTLNAPDVVQAPDLAASLRALPHLTRLSLSVIDTDCSLSALLPPDLVDRLEILHVWFGPVEQLPVSIASRSLQEVHLCVGLGPTSWLAMQCPALVELNVTETKGNHLTSLQCPRLRKIIVPAPQSLFGAALMPNLEEMSCWSGSVEDPAWLLAGSPWLRKLSGLRLTRTDLLARLCTCGTLVQLRGLSLDVIRLPNPLVLRLPGQLEDLGLHIERRDRPGEGEPLSVDLQVEAPGLLDFSLDILDKSNLPPVRARLHNCPHLVSLSVHGALFLQVDEEEEAGVPVATQPRELIVSALHQTSLACLLSRHGARLRTFISPGRFDAMTSADWPWLMGSLSGLTQLTRLDLNVSGAPSPLSLACPQLRRLTLYELPDEAKVALACPLLEELVGIRDPSRQLELPCPQPGPPGMGGVYLGHIPARLKSPGRVVFVPVMEKVPVVLTVEGSKSRKVLFLKNAGFEALKSLIKREFTADSVIEISYLSDGESFAIATDDSLEGFLQENPLPPLKIILSSAASQPPSQLPCAGNDAKQTPAEPPSVTIPLEPLPPLPMCILRLEAIGLSPRTVEIPPDQADSMRLEDFTVLLASQFEGRSVMGAPAIGASAGAATGLVDSAESLHSLLRASLAKPLVLQVPLNPLTVANSTKRKRKPKKEQPHAAEPQQAAHAQVEVPLPAASRGGPPTPADRNGPIRALLARLATPMDVLLANLPMFASLLRETFCVVHEDEKTTVPLLAASLVKLIDHPDLPTVCPAAAEQLVGEIGELCWKPEHRASFGRAGATAPLVKMLIANPTVPIANPRLAQSLLGAINNLSVDHPVNQASLGRAGVAAPLVRLLNAYPDLHTTCPVVAETLLAAVSILSSHDEIAPTFERAGVVTPLARLLIAYPNLPATCPGVAQHILRAMVSLSTLPECRASFARTEVAVPLVRMLVTYSTSPDVVEPLLLAVSNLSVAGENSIAFWRAGVVAPLARLLIARPDDAPAALFAVIANMSMIPECRAAFGRAGVVAPLVKLLVAHPNLPAASPIAEALFTAVGILATDADNRASFARAGVATPLAGMLVGHPDLLASRPEVAEKLILAIANLSGHEEHRNCFARAGVIALLVKLLGVHYASPALCEQILRALANLASDPFIRIPYFTCARLAAVVAKLLPRLPAPSPAVAKQVLRMVSVLSVDPPSRAAFAAVRPAIQRFLDVPGVDPMIVGSVEEFFP
ncbi:hypothetical protein PAPYR_4192 [Paratrimastix pyriformis]|uniref:Uncharacterized protein n=1 Tax=Paratrimastix pyriformis TaxID=342808 RepID=A0ABQ8USS5_9EUKA|nr:hypothetical protein PAPYR_4192 [Paratrimastix pyriformis]